MSDMSRRIGSTIDHSRRSVSVPRRLMPAILAVHTGERPGPDAAITELRKDGLMASRRLDPLLTTLIEVMTNPALVMTIEVARSRGLRLATIWGTRRRAVIGMTDDRDRFDLLQIEPGLLPFHLAQTTGLVPQPRPPFAGSCSLPAAVLNLAEDLIIAQPERAEAALTGAGVPTEWADRILIALTHRRSMWTVESVWLGTGNGRSQTRLSVLDAGPAGYWLINDDGHGDRVQVAVSDFEDLMRRFAALLPSTPPAGSIEI